VTGAAAPAQPAEPQPEEPAARVSSVGTGTAPAALVTRARISRGSLSLSVAKPGARVSYRITAGKGRGAKVLARGTATVAADGRAGIRLSRKAKRALARTGRLTVTVTVAGEPDGQTLTVRR
jgi:hypothetical protein